jgi:hypothetical protein
MNTTKGFVLALSVLVCYLFSQGQNNPNSASQNTTKHQNALKRSAYIFEGSITEQENYHGKRSGGMLLTCTVMQITKIFKGSPQIKLGSIKVITMQDKRVQDGSNAALGKSGNYIVIGNVADSADLNSNMTLTDNFITVSSSNIVVLSQGINNEHTAQWEGGRWSPGTSYNSVDSLYSFFRQNGITIQEQVDSTKEK